MCYRWLGWGNLRYQYWKPHSLPNPGLGDDWSWLVASQRGGAPGPYTPHFSKTPGLDPLFLPSTLIQVLGWVPNPLDLAPSPWWSTHYSNLSGATAWPPPSLTPTPPYFAEAWSLWMVTACCLHVNLFREHTPTDGFSQFSRSNRASHNYGVTNQGHNRLPLPPGGRRMRPKSDGHSPDTHSVWRHTHVSWQHCCGWLHATG